MDDKTLQTLITSLSPVVISLVAAAGDKLAAIIERELASKGQKITDEELYALLGKVLTDGAKVNREYKSELDAFLARHGVQS